jgi:hypothetical protein
MKKTFIILLTSAIQFLLSNVGFSQTTHLHLVLNAVSTNFDYGKSNDQLQSFKKRVVGAQLGVSFQAGITPRFSVVPELYLIMKGGSLKSDNPITQNESTLRLYVLELPVLARFHFGKLYLNAGPYISYNMVGRMNIEGSNTMAEKSTNVGFDNSATGFKRWDSGTQVGAGYFFNLKKSRLALDVRYCYGLTNISNDVERYNRLLNISLIVSRPWKKNPFARKTN